MAELGATDAGTDLTGRVIPTNFRRAAYLPHIHAAEARYARRLASSTRLSGPNRDTILWL